MTPIDLLIRSKVDPKGFFDATKLVEELGEAVKQGFGINIGQKIGEAIEEIPKFLKEAAQEGIKFDEQIRTQPHALTPYWVQCHPRTNACKNWSNSPKRIQSSAWNK